MAQSKEQARALVLRVREAYDVRALRPASQAVKDALAPLRRTFSLGPGAYPWFLTNPTAVLCARRVAAAAIVLSQIDPQQWRLVYDPVRTVIHTAYLFAQLAGDSATSDRLEPALHPPAPYAATQHIERSSLADIIEHDIPIVADQPPQPFRDGEWLTDGFCHPDRVAAGIGQAHPMPDALALVAMGDLHMLATMWVFGGTSVWPRERIESAAADIVDQWHRLPGWAPGW
ncbi:MAG TPA: hypothetical protein VGC67_02785 [Cellulomonas sp.]